MMGNLLAIVAYFGWAVIGWELHARHVRLPYRRACDKCAFKVSGSDSAVVDHLADSHSSAHS